MPKNPSFFQKFSALLGRLPIAAGLTLVAGILLLVFPEGALAAVVRTVGILLFLYAILSVFSLAADRLFHIESLFLLFLEIALLIVALVLVVDPESSLLFLVRVSGIYLLFDGIYKLYRLLMTNTRAYLVLHGTQPTSLPARIFTVIFCALTIAAGIYLLVSTPEAARTIAIVLGVCLILESGQEFLRYFFVLSARRAEEKKNRPEYIEAEFTDKSNDGI